MEALTYEEPIHCHSPDPLIPPDDHDTLKTVRMSEVLYEENDMYALANAPVSTVVSTNCIYTQLICVQLCVQLECVHATK